MCNFTEWADRIDADVDYINEVERKTAVIDPKTLQKIVMDSVPSHYQPFNDIKLRVMLVSIDMMNSVIIRVDQIHAALRSLVESGAIQSEGESFARFKKVA